MPYAGNFQRHSNFANTHQNFQTATSHSEVHSVAHNLDGQMDGVAKPSRVTLQPISESKRIMSNPSRGYRGQEPFDQAYDAQGMIAMGGQPYEQHANINNISTSYVNQISVSQPVSGFKPRFSGGTSKKLKKNQRQDAMSNPSNLSMVVVMNNLVQKRSKNASGGNPPKQNKRGSSSN